MIKKEFQLFSLLIPVAKHSFSCLMKEEEEAPEVTLQYEFYS